MVKKQLIMEKSLELFAKQGFEATSVQQITEHCGISKGAFYLSFKSKDELIIALIDQFMMQIIADIDYIVRNTEDSQLLYQFYYAIYHAFQKHSDFAKVLMKEHSQTFNKDLILKMQYYDKLLESNILLLVERLYAEEVEETKYDLMYTIKGFMNMYSQLFVFYNVPLDLQVLSESLVEKTSLLAQHMTIPFVTKELGQMFKKPMQEEGTKEQLGIIMEQKIEEMEESIEKESLLLLRQELLDPSQPPAVVKGLIENIRKHPHCKWISFLLRQYFGF
ncbi:TetR/AcrR family transcriptional regulator [Neobacillus sp. MM2021_6]|uniref:TetR/AcrR family transcriptional regulator n=1 Tax=Bacillaceae TaxID=186817 RepID=UPI00140B8631|nr:MULTISPECIES: TetR/AcrR family transcriptional regulator [Bacillaceae]MBO0958720.1 TetR/AcrR family transcriptional regulator [Neobacillus sp. MM2021_6]NHC18185.1 TetR/AcrR family transcriptional regulator [Bacillus sp. MM2020_4]